MAVLPDRIRDLGARIDVARDEAQGAEFSDDLGEATEDLFRSARALRGTVTALKGEDGDAG